MKRVNGTWHIKVGCEWMDTGYSDLHDVSIMYGALAIASGRYRRLKIRRFYK